MFLSEGIIRNFIEGLEEEEILNIEAIDSEEEAYKYIASLYRKNYGTDPSGVGVYLLRTKFSLGAEEFNRKFIPSNLSF